VQTGRETHAIPSARTLQNIENNKKAQEAKASRIKANQKAGDQRAAAGDFKKGKK